MLKLNFAFTVLLPINLGGKIYHSTNKRIWMCKLTASLHTEKNPVIIFEHIGIIVNTTAQTHRRNKKIDRRAGGSKEKNTTIGNRETTSK